MKEMVDPSGFVQAILIASTTLLVVSSAFMVYLASSKQSIKSRIKSILNPMLLFLIVSYIGGISTIVLSLVWFFTSPNSILSENQLWVVWISFAIQFGGFIVMTISFLFYAQLIPESVFSAKAGIASEREKEEKQIAKSTTGGTTELIVDQRQLADRIGTIFVVGLISLWLGLKQVAEVPTERLAWWLFVILSLLVVLLWFWGKKRGSRPGPRWWYLCIVVIAIWVMYWSSGVPASPASFLVLSGILFLWIVVLCLAFVLAKTSYRQRGLGKVVIRTVMYGDHLYPFLLFVVLFTSVLTLWVSLKDTGASGNWVYALLLVGVLISVVVPLVYSWPSRRQD